MLLAVKDLHGQLRVQALGDATLAVTDDKTYAFTNPAYLSALSQPTTFFTMGRRGGTQRSEQTLDYALDTGVVVSETRPRDPDHRTDRTARSDWLWTWGGLLSWKSRFPRGSRVGLGMLVRQQRLTFEQASRIFTAGRWVRDPVRQAYIFDADFWKESRTQIDHDGTHRAVMLGAGLEWGSIRAGLAGTMAARDGETHNQTRFTNSEGFILTSRSDDFAKSPWGVQAFRMGWAYRMRSHTVIEGYLVLEHDRERQQPATSAGDSVDGPPSVRSRDQRRTLVLRSIHQVGVRTHLVQQLGLRWGDGDVRMPIPATGHRSETVNTLEIRADLGLSAQLRPETLLVGEAHGTWSDATRATFETTGTQLMNTEADTTGLRVNVGIEQHVRTVWALRIGMVSQHSWFRTEQSQFDPVATVPLALSTTQSRARQIQLTAGLGYRYRSFLEAHYAFKTDGTLIDDSHAVELVVRF
ncbi:MAG: hypothetical protein HY710_09955 [Candidatus Latescibacteria bacterium]|nr:hypothetical protein [Candidatus Latescibacterota bacterium]